MKIFLFVSAILAAASLTESAGLSEDVPDTTATWVEPTTQSPMEIRFTELAEVAFGAKLLDTETKCEMLAKEARNIILYNLTGNLTFRDTFEKTITMLDGVGNVTFAHGDARSLMLELRVCLRAVEKAQCSSPKISNLELIRLSTIQTQNKESKTDVVCELLDKAVDQMRQRRLGVIESKASIVRSVIDALQSSEAERTLSGKELAALLDFMKICFVQ